MSIVSNSPLTTLAFSTACLVLTVPTACKSISLSTVTSYRFSIGSGKLSTKFKLVKLTVSTNGSFRKMSLILTIANFSADSLSTNMP